MKSLDSAVFFSLLLASSFPTHAQQDAPKPPPKAVHQELPPPSIKDQGVSKSKSVEAAADTLEPTMPDTRLVRDKASRNKQRSVDEIRASSEVTQRKEGGDTIEEYREKGLLRMIRVIPQNGPEQIYMDTNGDGRLDRDPRDGPVSPVYFKLYEWN